MMGRTDWRAQGRLASKRLSIRHRRPRVCSTCARRASEGNARSWLACRARCRPIKHGSLGAQALELSIVETLINGAGAQQLGVRANGLNAAVVHDHDAI